MRRPSMAVAENGASRATLSCPKGGPISLIETVGLKKFVEECDRLAKAYGARFAPPQLLRDMAAKGETFYGNFKAAQKAAA